MVFPVRSEDLASPVTSFSLINQTSFHTGPAHYLCILLVFFDAPAICILAAD